MICLPQKAELVYLIPSLRKELALALKKNLSEKEIASRLGLTKSAISQYIHKKRGAGIKFPENIKKEIKKSADKIANGKSTGMAEIVNLLEIAKKSRFTCTICREVCK